ncbi:MAG: hypothetical protein KDA24_11520, partial [Deltaproteobacteria bacterium]|nr:hypothetical protein [Deltaproteobacteria bacterium]
PGFGAMLRQALGARPERRAVAGAVRAHLTRHGIEDADEAELLTRLAFPVTADLGGGNETGPLRNPEAVFAVLARFLERVANQRPLILWLDDVQWSFEAMAFLDWFRLRQGTHPSAVLVVATVRDDLLRGAPAVEELIDELEPTTVRFLRVPALDKEATQELVTELLFLSGDLADQVVDRCGGTPLFAVQLVGDLVARGALRATPQGFALVEGAEPTVPDDIHQLFDTAVDSALRRAGPHARARVELAAALSQPASHSELDAASEVLGIPSGSRALERLTRRGLVSRSSGGWTFVHVLLRESIARRARDEGRWGRAHLACAEALKKLAAPPERVGRHLAAGGALPDALWPLLMGAKNRLDRAYYVGTLELLDERDGVVEQLELKPEDPRHIQGELWRVRVLWRRKELAEVWPRVQALGRAVEQTGRADLRASFLLVKARTEMNLLRIEDAAVTRAQLEEVAEHLATPQEEFDRRILGGDLAERQGRRDESLALRSDGLRWARQSGNPVFQSTFSAHVGFSLLWQERLAEAEEVARELLELGRQRKEALFVASAQNLLAGVARARSDNEYAMDLMRESHRHYEAAGHYSKDIVLSNMSSLALTMGRWREAREAARRVERAFIARPAPPRVAMAQLIQAGSYGGEDRWEKCSELLDKAEATLAPCTSAQFGGFIAESIADRAEQAGWPDLARHAMLLAVMHHERRGDSEPLAAARERLAALDALLGEA